MTKAEVAAIPKDLRIFIPDLVSYFPLSRYSVALVPEYVEFTVDTENSDTAYLSYSRRPEVPVVNQENTVRQDLI